MAALESTRFVPFKFPQSNPPFCNTNNLWPAKTSRTIPSVTDSQKLHRPAAPHFHYGCQAEADADAAARADGRKRALADNGDDSDDDLPSLEQFFRTAPRPKVSGEASKTEPSSQNLEEPALNGVGTQVDRTKPGSGERQGDSPDQPVILDDDESDETSTEDEAEDAASDIETGCIDTSLYNTLGTADLAFGSTKSTDTSGPLYDVEKGCHIDEPTLRLGPCEQRDVVFALAQDETQILTQPSAQQDQTNQQDIDNITQSTSMEFAPPSLPKPSHGGDDGWAGHSIAELEKELGLALEEQENSLLAGGPTSPRPRSVEAPIVEIQRQERTGTPDSRPKELQDASRYAIAPGHEEWEQGETETVAEGGGVAMQELEEQEELAAQKGELGHPAQGEGDQQDLVEVIDADDPEDMQVTQALPATQPEIPKIDEPHFRLRGIRIQPLPGRQTKTTQYRVVWGEHPNRSDSWVNEEDTRISILRRPYERRSRGLVLQEEWNVVRVHRMRYDRCSKGKKIFEYLVNQSCTWIAEDQLRISLSPMLAAELKASSPYSLSQAQSDVLLRRSATPISDEHYHASRTSRGSSDPADPTLGAEPTTRKRRHQDTYTLIGDDDHHSVNTDDDQNTCDTGDEDLRSTKRRKPYVVPAVAPLYLRRSPRGGPLPTTRPNVDEVQSQDNHGCSSTLLDEQHHASRASRSPSAVSEAVPVADYQEWPFQGFLKRTRIGDDVRYNLEFRLPSISEHLQLPINPAALETCSSKEASAKAPTYHDTAVHSKIHQAPLKPKTGRAKWTKWTTEEDATLHQMRKDGCSWESIHAVLPHRSIGTIQVHYSTKLKR